MIRIKYSTIIIKDEDKERLTKLRNGLSYAKIIKKLIDYYEDLIEANE